MSSSITSPEVVSTTTTSHAWLGAAFNSDSVQRVNGAEARRNKAQDGSFETANGLTTVYAGVQAPSYDTGWFTSGARSVKLIASGTSNDSFAEVRFSDLVPQRVYTVSADVRLTSAQGPGFFGPRARGISVFGAENTFEVNSSQAPNTAGVTRVVLTFTASSNTQPIMRLYNGSTVAGDSVWFDSLVIEEGATARGFFDGSSPGSTVTQLATAMPLLVDGYQSTRQSRHVFNNVIGRAYPDVTLLPAAPRRGTLTLIFATEAEALLCERMHIGTQILTFADSDVPTAGMTYVVDGSVTRRLDPSTRALWLVQIDYQEVTL